MRLAVALAAATFTLSAWAQKPPPSPSPQPYRYWQCSSKLKDKPRSGRVCAAHEQAAVDECGATICDLDLICQGQCQCAPTTDACAPFRR